MSAVSAGWAAPPHRWVMGLIGIQLAVWTLVPAWSHLSLPLDVVREGLAWGHEWQAGYHKHPPLMSWLTEASFRWFGKVGPFLLSQLAVAVCYWFVFLLGRQLLGARAAALGTLLLTGSYYFSFPTPEFNHNVLQMPFWAALCYVFYRAVQQPGIRYWLVLGVLAGFGLLAKYSVLVLLAVMGGYLLWVPMLRRQLWTPGPWLAVLVAALILMPHLWWLLEHDWATLQYFRQRSGAAGSGVQRLLEPLDFLLANTLCHLPMLLLLLLSMRWPAQQERMSADTRRFLYTLAFAPALLVAAGSLLSGAGLRDAWGTPMWNLSGLVAVAWLGSHRLALRPLLYGVASLLVLVPTLYAGKALYGSHFTDRPHRSGWPGAELAQGLAAAWHTRTACPLRIVAGEPWLAGLVAMHMPTRPTVLWEASLVQSPWLRAEQLGQQGVLAVWRTDTDRGYVPPVRIAALTDIEYGGALQFDWPRWPQGAPLQLAWAIVPPAACPAGATDDP